MYVNLLKKTRDEFEIIMCQYKSFVKYVKSDMKFLGREGMKYYKSELKFVFKLLF